MSDRTKKDNDPDKPVELCRVHSLVQADLLKADLEAGGIIATLVGEYAKWHPYRVQDNNEIKVFVPLSQWSKACAIRDRKILDFSS